MKPQPRLIALCGYPKAGKSLVQEILAKNHLYQPVDDGGPLRNIAMQYLGLTAHQVYSQAGKAETVEILGKSWMVREILGELGNKFEAMFGEFILPFMVTRSLPKDDTLFSFGSVRKRQAAFYKAEGGLCIGIRRPGTEPSPFAFDWFDPDLVDVWIDNDGTLAELEAKVAAALEQAGELRRAA